MAGHPVGDQLKIKVDSDTFGFGGSKKGVETGVVVESPENIFYVGFHSFAFENSFMNGEKLDDFDKLAKSYIGKRVFWESLQDRGRRFVEGKDEFAYIKLTDIIFYADSVNDDIQLAGEGGFSA